MRTGLYHFKGESEIFLEGASGEWSEFQYIEQRLPLTGGSLVCPVLWCADMSRFMGTFTGRGAGAPRRVRALIYSFPHSIQAIVLSDFHLSI